MKWAYAGNWGDKAFASLFTFLLAGILGPKDFGLISIAAVYIGFLQLFLDQGFAAALIQRKNIEQEHLDTVFWLNIGVSMLLVLVSLLFGRYWAEFNHAPEAAVIIPILSLSIIFEALAIVQISQLKRNMDFRSLAIRSNASVILSGIAGTSLALAGFGVWSLVGQQLVRDITAFILLWKMSSWRPRLEFSWNHLRELIGFSGPNFVAQLGIFCDGQAAMIALGILFGPVAVGIYRLAERVTSSVISMTMSATQAVSLPEFARHQDNPAGLRQAALTCIRLASTVTMPALAGLAVVSHPLMATVGSKWEPAANVLTVLAVVGILVIFTFFTGPLLQALGRTRALAGLEWGRTVMGLVSLVVAGLIIRNTPDTWQVMGIAFARLATAVLFTAPLFLYLFLRLCRLTVGDFFRSIMPSTIASISVVLSVLLFNLTGWFSHDKPIVLLLADVIIGAMVGLPLLLSLDHQLRDFIKGLLQRIFPPAKTTA